MPKGYVILTEDIKDPAGMQAYGKAAGPSFAASGARIIAITEPQVVEGGWPSGRIVVVEFDSEEAARAWYESAEYQQAKPLRQAAAECSAVIFSGLG